MHKQKKIADFFAPQNQNSSSSSSKNEKGGNLSNNEPSKRKLSENKCENENEQPKKVAKKPKAFIDRWLQGREWLIFDREKNVMLCNWCMETHGKNMPGGHGAVWVTTGSARFEIGML